MYTKPSWPMISNKKNTMVDEACKLTIEAQNCQRALPDAPVGGPSVWQLPSGPFLKINPQTQAAVSVYSAFCSSIGLMMKLNRKYIHS